MDRRIKYTKSVIKNTFLSLLEEKDINKISVSEVCSKADINRATFYRYYLDLYDLLDKIELEFVNELKEVVEKREYNVISFSYDVLNTFLKNKEILKVIFKSKSNIYSLNEFLEVVYEKCKYRWTKDIPEISEENIEYATAFIFNGALGVINYWVQNDFDLDVDILARRIEELSYYGIKKYIYHE